MLHESGDSMMAISSRGVSTMNLETSFTASDVPFFRAAGVDQTGILSSVQPFRDKAVIDGATGTSQSASGSLCSRVLSDATWRLLERGLRQRFEAVYACMEEVVSRRKIPAIFHESSYLPSAIATMLEPIQGTTCADVAWTWLGSTDIHLGSTGELTVFDHNFSLPTGLERLAQNDDAAGLADILFSGWTSRHNAVVSQGIAVLDPGFYSATFRGNEFLARCLNAHLARCTDLTIKPDGVYLKVGLRLVRISTIVRRIDDDLLDPNCFRPDSLVGLPGLVRAWKNGLVNVMSPPGSGFANSRSFGRLIPNMIRELLGEEPLLGSVEVHECGIPEVFKNVLANVEGYAIRTNDPRHPARPFFGRDGRAVDFSDLLVRIRRNPAAYVARPLLPANQDPGINLRMFATRGNSFRLLRAAIGREPQPDGGAAFSIGNDGAGFTIM